MLKPWATVTWLNPNNTFILVSPFQSWALAREHVASMNKVITAADSNDFFCLITLFLKDYDTKLKIPQANSVHIC
jgi:hypothetical protein